ncbi:MAG: RNA 2',3'-cyclic phosphodiesterase [Oscillospiraceae bacterium]|nr:RNA 2',3'-cyclic phosphodiesterase [Oscillospiraceae bacterium]
MRLFVAIPFSREFRAALLAAQEDLRTQGARANYTRPENLHLTLAFIGETERYAAAEEAVAQVEAWAFPLRLADGGHFGQLYWAGLDQSAPLEKLAERVQGSLRAAGFAVERKPFRPHVTLARQLSAPGPVQVHPEPAEMTADRMCLMCSERVNGRLVHTPLYEKPLGA